MTLELNPRLSFESFVVGPGNEMAVTAARAAADTPGAVYNPLFLYSAPGLGKTHLLMAVGQRARSMTTTVTVEYLTVDDFAEAFQAASAVGQGDAFRRRIADADILLFDDVHLLAQRNRLRVEIRRLADEMIRASGKQVIFAADSAPNAIAGIDDDLATWFASGLVVDVAPPNYATRLTILQGRAADREAAFEEGVLEAVARFEIQNVRELLGVLNRLVALQAVSEQPLTPDAARTLLEGEALTIGEVPAPSDEPLAVADEFADFVSGVSETLHEQVDAWESRLTTAIERWSGAGYKTSRLEVLLGQENPVIHEGAVTNFEEDVARLETLRHKAASMNPALAQDPVFFDPDEIDAAKAFVEQLEQHDEQLPGPSSEWNFATFINSESTRAAVEAAHATVSQPGAGPSPFLVVGSAGVGKSHLLHALGNAAVEAGLTVACYSASELQAEVREASKRGEIETWRARVLRADMLLVDDLQLLGTDSTTQHELAVLSQSFFESNRQLSFALSAPPAEIQGLSNQTVANLSRGQVATLESPDRSLRHALAVRTLAERIGAADPELADYLADRPAESVRAVLSLIQRVFTSAEERNVPPTAALARELIEGALPRVQRPSAPMRTSGVLVSPSGGIRSREKMIWDWPNPADRLVEDLM